MSRSRKGPSKAKQNIDWWSRRPLSGIGPLRKNNKVLKRMVHKRERLAARRDIAARFLEAREAAGMSQLDVATAAGTTQCRVSEIEAARGNPRFDTLSRVASAVKLKISVRSTRRKG